MKIRTITTALLLLVVFQTFIYAAKIEIKGRRLYVNNRPFTIKGVCYSGVPVGKDYTYAWEYDSQACTMDFPLIRAMGANCIRTYHEFPAGAVAAMDSAYKNGLYVIMEMGVTWNTDYTNYQVRTNMINKARSMVMAWKDHPALLVWCIGHENNVNIHLTNGGLKLDTLATNRLKTFYPFLNELAGLIHEWEKPAWHPVAYGEAVADSTNFGIYRYAAGGIAGATTVGNPVFFSDDANMGNFDMWGIQVYNGAGFDPDLFSRYKTLSSKPLWIAETGCDAFNIARNAEDQDSQSVYVMRQWTEISNNLSALSDNGIITGVTFFNWDDGWWKYSSGSFWTHDTNGTWPNASYTYDYIPGRMNMNEEWWGFVSIFPGTYERGLRKVYYDLQKRWVSGSETNELSGVLFRKKSVNVPNPFNLTAGASTMIWAYLNHASEVTALIYDYSGRLVRELNNPSSFSGFVYGFDWDGRDKNGHLVRTGVYLCKIKARMSVLDSSEQESQLVRIAVVK